MVIDPSQPAVTTRHTLNAAIHPLALRSHTRASVDGISSTAFPLRSGHRARRISAWKLSFAGCLGWRGVRCSTWHSPFAPCSLSPIRTQSPAHTWHPDQSQHLPTCCSGRQPRLVRNRTVNTAGVLGPQNSMHKQVWRCCRWIGSAGMRWLDSAEVCIEFWLPWDAPSS